MPARYPRADAKGVRAGGRQQGQVGQERQLPRDREHGQQRSEDGEVGQRVQQVEQEGAWPLPRGVELRAERHDPADD